jgi:hypothetical protein
MPIGNRDTISPKEVATIGAPFAAVSVSMPAAARAAIPIGGGRRPAVATGVRATMTASVESWENLNIRHSGPISQLEGRKKFPTFSVVGSNRFGPIAGASRCRALAESKLHGAIEIRGKEGLLNHNSMGPQCLNACNIATDEDVGHLRCQKNFLYG